MNNMVWQLRAICRGWHRCLYVADFVVDHRTFHLLQRGACLWSTLLSICIDPGKQFPFRSFTSLASRAELRMPHLLPRRKVLLRHYPSTWSLPSRVGRTQVHAHKLSKVLLEQRNSFPMIVDNAFSHISTRPSPVTWSLQRISIAQSWAACSLKVRASEGPEALFGRLNVAPDCHPFNISRTRSRL